MDNEQQKKKQNKKNTGPEIDSDQIEATERYEIERARGRIFIRFDRITKGTTCHEYYLLLIPMKENLVARWIFITRFVLYTTHLNCLYVSGPGVDDDDDYTATTSTTSTSTEKTNDDDDDDDIRARKKAFI